MLALCYHATTESSSSGRGDVDRAECTGWPRRGGRIALRFNGWQERHGMLRSFRREMRAHPRLSMGFGLFWTWVWLVFQTTFFNPPFLAALDFPLPGWVVPLSAYACTFLVLGVLLKARRIVPQGRWYRIAVPASMSIGVTTCGILSFSPLTVELVNVAAVCLGGLLMGAGTACFMWNGVASWAIWDRAPPFCTAWWEPWWLPSYRVHHVVA